jgi:ribosome-associated toxin RatA of RatAB toxin-antitoxin module
MSIDAISKCGDRGGDPGALLAETISVNALFSGGCGLLLLAAATALTVPLGLPAWWLAGVGVGLLAFAGLLLWILAEPRRLAAGGRAALAADLAWVVGAVVVLVGFPSVLTPTGRTALTMLTGVVALLTSSQAMGLSRIRGRTAMGTSRLTLRAQRTIAAHPERVWAAVADVADYARFASGIAATEVVSGDGEGMVRACTDQRGGHWRETCTQWDEGHRYRMTVDVDTYPLSYRLLLHELAQTWSVEPVGDHTRVTLAFDASLKLGIIGTLAGAVLGRQLRIDEILDAYEEALSPAGAGPPA